MLPLHSIIPRYFTDVAHSISRVPSDIGCRGILAFLPTVGQAYLHALKMRNKVSAIYTQLSSLHCNPFPLGHKRIISSAYNIQPLYFNLITQPTCSLSIWMIKAFMNTLNKVNVASPWRLPLRTASNVDKRLPHLTLTVNLACQLLRTSLSDLGMPVLFRSINNLSWSTLSNVPFDAQETNYTVLPFKLE